MSTRTALLFASAALFAVATPALAQDGRYGDLPAEAAADAAADAADAALRSQLHDGNHDGQSGGEARHGGHHGAMRGDMGEEVHQAAPRFAYSEDEREQWLADCRTVMRGEEYYQAAYEERVEDDRDDGGLIGGLLGAVVGGVAGNRIGGAGDRLAGTLIGVGLGGIAGAVLGSVISGDGDRDDYDYDGDFSTEAVDAYASDYCAAYLRQYEASGSTGQYVVAYAQPMMMMQASHHGGGSIRERITEEWVEVPAEYVEVRRTHRRAAPPQRGKLTSTN